MPIDYRIPAEIGAIRSRMIDPMTLANLREQVAARRERQAQEQAQVEQQNTLRNLLSQSVVQDEAGQYRLNEPVARQVVQMGGLSDLKNMLSTFSPDQGGGQFAASMTPGIDTATGLPVFLQPNRAGGATVVPGYTPMTDTPAQRQQKAAEAQKREQQKLERTDKGQKIDIELKLAKQYDDQSKDYVTVKKQADIIRSALNDPSAIGTLAAATAIMKMLDPGSVVRESELGMAMKSTGAIDRLGNYFNVVEKGQVLTPDQKKEFAGLVDQFVAAYDAAQRNVNARFAKRADSYGLNVENIVTIPIGGAGEIGASGIPAMPSRRPATSGGKPLRPAIDLNKVIPR